jgi:hypothetical protein
MNVEVEDIVMVHGLHTGKVVDKFLSATGAEVYDIKLVYGPFTGSRSRGSHPH